MRASTALLILASPVFGFKLTGSILPNAVLNSTTVPLESRLEVDFDKRVPFRADGSFEVEVSPGQHVVRAIVPGYDMSGFIVTVPEEAPLKPAQPSAESAAEDDEAKDGGERQGEAEGQAAKAETKKDQLHVQAYYPNRQALATTSPSLAYPLVITAVQKEEYYTAAPSMQLVALLKSPMVLLMLGTSVFALLLPKLTASLENDPEMAKDLAEARKKMNSIMSGDAGAQLANRLVDNKQQASPASSAGRGGNNGAKRGGKRR